MKSETSLTRREVGSLVLGLCGYVVAPAAADLAAGRTWREELWITAGGASVRPADFRRANRPRVTRAAHRRLVWVPFRPSRYHIIDGTTFVPVREVVGYLNSRYPDLQVHVHRINGQLVISRSGPDAIDVRIVSKGGALPKQGPVEAGVGQFVSGMLALGEARLEPALAALRRAEHGGVPEASEVRRWLDAAPDQTGVLRLVRAPGLGAGQVVVDGEPLDADAVYGVVSAGEHRVAFAPDGPDSAGAERRVRVQSGRVTTVHIESGA